jgi:hypothetical protein
VPKISYIPLRGITALSDGSTMVGRKSACFSRDFGDRERCEESRAGDWYNVGRERRRRKWGKESMADHALCPGCRHANPPENRFCGSCGASLEASSDLQVRRENDPTVRERVLPARVGPVGKAIAVGLAMLATQVGISWLRHRVRGEDRTLTPTRRESGAVEHERLVGRALEEILIQELDADARSRTFAWRAIRSIVVTERESSGPRSELESQDDRAGW